MKTIWFEASSLKQLSGEKDERRLPQLGALMVVVNKDSPFFQLRGHKRSDSRQGKSVELSIVC